MTTEQAQEEIILEILAMEFPEGCRGRGQTHPDEKSPILEGTVQKGPDPYGPYAMCDSGPNLGRYYVWITSEGPFRDRWLCVEGLERIG